MFCHFYHIAFELLCVRLCAQQCAGCILRLQVGSRAIEESLRKGLFTELWAGPKEPTGAGISQAAILKVQGGGRCYQNPGELKHDQETLTGARVQPQHIRERDTRPTLSCSGHPLAKPSQKQRARKLGDAACRGHLPRAQSGSWEQMENNQHTLSWKMSFISHFTAGQTEAQRHKEMK